MFTLKFSFMKTALTSQTGNGFFITFSGNRIYRYQGIKPEEVLGRVITANTNSELRGTYVVMKGHTLFSVPNNDFELIRDLMDNRELVSTVDSLKTFREFMEL